MTSVKSNRGVRSVLHRAKKTGERRDSAVKDVKVKICPNCEKPADKCRCEPDDGVRGWSP